MELPIDPDSGRNQHLQLTQNPPWNRCRVTPALPGIEWLLPVHVEVDSFCLAAKDRGAQWLIPILITESCRQGPTPRGPDHLDLLEPATERKETMANVALPRDGIRSGQAAGSWPSRSAQMKRRMSRTDVSHPEGPTEGSWRKSHPELPAHRRPRRCRRQGLIESRVHPHVSPTTASATEPFGRSNCQRPSQSVLNRRLRFGPLNWEGMSGKTGLQPQWDSRPGPTNNLGAAHPRNAGWVHCSLFVLLVDGV
jgi:hypothetical protein